MSNESRIKVYQILTDTRTDPRIYEGILAQQGLELSDCVIHSISPEEWTLDPQALKGSDSVFGRAVQELVAAIPAESSGDRDAHVHELARQIVNHLTRQDEPVKGNPGQKVDYLVPLIGVNELTIPQTKGLEAEGIFAILLALSERRKALGITTACWTHQNNRPSTLRPFELY